LQHLDAVKGSTMTNFEDQWSRWYLVLCVDYINLGFKWSDFVL